MSRRHFDNASASSSSKTVSVTRHDPSCAVLYGGSCECQPETRDEKYVRVCANCGGELSDRRRPYCSKACRQDTRIRAKNLSARQESEEIRAAEP